MDVAQSRGNGSLSKYLNVSAGLGSMQADTPQALRAGYDDALWQLRTLVEGLPHLVWRSCDMGNWTWSSPQWMAFTGQTQEESLGLGWMNVVHPDDRTAAMEGWAEARPHGKLDVEFRVRRAADGVYIWHHTRSLPARSESGEIIEWLGTTSNIQDRKMLQEQQAKLLSQVQQQAEALTAEVQERRRTETQLSYTAFHDELTKLPNRSFFMGQLRRLLARFRNDYGNRSVVLVLDLDRFKQVNASIGHAAGDMLLTVLGRRLTACAGADGTVARLGGDEFGIIVDGLDEPAFLDLVARVRETVRRPVRLGPQEIVPSCSLGATWVKAAHTKAADLLQEAEIALHDVKNDQRGGFRLFAQPMRAEVSRALDLRNDLRTAVAKGELELHYQPICATATREITGFEALVRWRHPTLGLIPPSEFISLAEESGLICSIGRWALQNGCAQLSRWQQQRGTGPLTLNINVCGDELKDPAFVDGVTATLAATGIAGSSLELEITEGVLLERSATVLGAMAALRNAGVRVAIDDFGTGYSSLSYLDRFDIDTVKIDKSFVSRMLVEPRTRAVLEAIMGLGRTLDIRIVAEGVENDAELDLLSTMHCDAVQGFLLGRPCPAEEMVLSPA